MTARLAVLCVLAALYVAPPAIANTSHAGWPEIDGMLLMNKRDQDRPLVAVPGRDPFGSADATYSCDGLHHSQSCLFDNARRDGDGWVVKATRHHNELLGGHGDDNLQAGPNGDVLWADYKPDGQSTSQWDRLLGGVGKDYIYASHGRNDIDAGPGADVIHAHFGHGEIDCGDGRDVLYISRMSRPGYRIRHCESLSYATLGY